MEVPGFRMQVTGFGEYAEVRSKKYEV